MRSGVGGWGLANFLTWNNQRFRKIWKHFHPKGIWQNCIFVQKKFLTQKYVFSKHISRKKISQTASANSTLPENIVSIYYIKDGLLFYVASSFELTKQIQTSRPPQPSPYIWVKEYQVLYIITQRHIFSCKFAKSQILGGRRVDFF